MGVFGHDPESWAQARSCAYADVQVQDAILHNKRIFEQRMMSEGRALQRRALHGWQVLMQHKAAKRNKLACVQGRLQQGLLVRVFYSWKDELPHLDKTLAMKRKVGCNDPVDGLDVEKLCVANRLANS
jgi:hypothetical protein